MSGEEPEDPIRAHLRRTFVRMGYDRKQWLTEFINHLDQRDIDRVFAALNPLIQDVVFYDGNGRHLDRRGGE